VALPALARRTQLLLLLIVGPPAVKQSIDVSCPPGSQQQTRRSGRMGQTDRQTDRRVGRRKNISTQMRVHTTIP